MAVNLQPSDLLTVNSPPAKRGEVTHFSGASRRRMMDLLAKIDAKQIPYFVSLTYPDVFPGDCEQVKRDLEVFAARVIRRWPEACLIWKLEFEPRKSGVNKGKLAPHLHVFAFNVPWTFPFKSERRKNYRVLSMPGGSIETKVFACGVLVSMSVHSDDQDSIIEWVRRNWYDVVNSQDGKHYSAGTRVEKLRTVNGAYSYASKAYAAKAQDVKELKSKPGRFWGVFNRKFLPLGQRQSYRITKAQAIQLRRFIRRYRRANTPPEKRRWLFKGSGANASKGFSVKLYCNADFWIERLAGLIGKLPEPDVVRPLNAYQRQFL
jgi:hypothetical protein